jgi:hypothetical protein
LLRQIDPEEVVSIEEEEKEPITVEKEKLKTMHKNLEKPCKDLKEGTAHYFGNKLFVFWKDLEDCLMEKGKRILEEIDPMKGEEE